MSGVIQVKPIAQTLGILQDFCKETLMSENINETIIFKLVNVMRNIEKYGPSYRQLLQPIIHCVANMLSTTKNEESVKPHITNLSYILKQCLNKANRSISYSSSPAKLENLITSLVAEIGEMIEKKHKLKYYILETLFEPLVDLITLPQLNFDGKLEVTTLMNLLLQGVSSNIRVEIREKNKIVIESLLVHLTLCGDYEIQQGITEILVRLAPTKQRIDVGDAWFAGNSVLVTKFSKLGAQDFEAECRDFLSAMNRVIGTGATVFTYTCESIYVGDCKLFKPKSEMYKSLLMDLNTNTSSLTFCCSDDVHDAVLARVKAGDLKYASLVPLDNQRLQITIQVQNPFQEFQQTKLKDDTLVRIILRNDSSILPKQLKNIFGSKIEIHEDLIKRTLQTDDSDIHKLTKKSKQLRVSEGVKLVQQLTTTEVTVLKTDSVNNKKMKIFPPLLSRNPADIPISDTSSNVEKENSLPKDPFTPPKLISSASNAMNCKTPLKTFQAKAPSTPTKIKPTVLEAATVTESAELPGDQCLEATKLSSKSELTVEVQQENKDKTVVNKLSLKGNKSKAKQTDIQKLGSCTTLQAVESKIKCNKNSDKNQFKDFPKQDQEFEGNAMQKQDKERDLSNENSKPSKSNVVEPKRVEAIKNSRTYSNKSQTKAKVSCKTLGTDVTKNKFPNSSKIKESIEENISESRNDIDPLSQKPREVVTSNKNESKSVKNKTIVQNKSKGKVNKPYKEKEIKLPYQRKIKHNKMENSTQESDAHLEGVAQLFQSPAQSKIRLAPRTHARKSRLPHLEFLNEQQIAELPPAAQQKRRLYKPSTPQTTYEEFNSNKTSNKGNKCTMKINQTFQLKNSLHIQFSMTPKSSRNANAATYNQPSVYSDFEELGGTLEKWTKKEVAPCRTYDNKNKKVCAKKRGYHVSSIQMHPVDILPTKKPCYLPSLENAPSLFTSCEKPPRNFDTNFEKPVKNLCSRRQGNSKITRGKENSKKTQVGTQRGRKKNTNNEIIKELENIWSQDFDALPDLVIEKESRTVPVTKPPTPPFLKYRSTLAQDYNKPPNKSFRVTKKRSNNHHLLTASQESCEVLRTAMSPCSSMLPLSSLSCDVEPLPEPELPPDFEPIVESSPPVHMSVTHTNIDPPVRNQQETCDKVASVAQTMKPYDDKKTNQKDCEKITKSAKKNCDKKLPENKKAGTKRQNINIKPSTNTVIAAIEETEPQNNMKSNEDKTTKEIEKRSTTEKKKHDVDTTSLESHRSKCTTSVDKNFKVPETKNNPKSKLNTNPLCSQAKDNNKLSLQTYSNKSGNANVKHNLQSSLLNMTSNTRCEKNNTGKAHTESNKTFKESEQLVNKSKSDISVVKEISNKNLETEHQDKSCKAPKTYLNKNKSDIISATQTEKQVKNIKIPQSKESPINRSMPKNNTVKYKSSKMNSDKSCDEHSTEISKKKQQPTSDACQINLTKNLNSNMPNITENLSQYIDKVIDSDLEFVADSQPVFSNAISKPVTFSLQTRKENIQSEVPQALVPESSSISSSEEDSPIIPAPDKSQNKKKQEIIKEAVIERSRAYTSNQLKRKKLTKSDIAAELEHLSRNNKRPVARKRSVLKGRNQESSSESSAVPSSDSESEHEVEAKKKKLNHPKFSLKPTYPSMQKSRQERFNPRYSSTVIAGQESSSQSQKSHKSLRKELSLSPIVEVTGLVTDDASETEDVQPLTRSTLSVRGVQKSYIDEMVQKTGSWTKKTVNEVTLRRCEIVRRFQSVLELEAEQAEDRLDQLTDLQIRVCKSRNMVKSNYAKLQSVLENQSTRDEVVVQQCARVKQRLHKQLSGLLQSHCNELLELTKTLKEECHKVEEHNLVSSMRAKLALMF